MADEATFEDLFAKLEEKARRLEEGNLPLEESLALYADGVDVVDRLRAMLDTAELQVEQLRDRLADDRQRLHEVEQRYDDVAE